MSGDLDIIELYEHYGRAIYRRCQYFLRNDDDARDAMQEVFIKAMAHGDTFRSEASPLTWLVPFQAVSGPSSLPRTTLSPSLVLMPAILPQPSPKKN